MKASLNDIRAPGRRVPFRRAVLYTSLISAAGLLSGVVAKLLDIYPTVLGDIFSEMSVWIFICTVISVQSSTPSRAAANVFSFCIGMVAAYYLTAELTASYYSLPFVYGWTVFAFITPAFAFCTWYAKGKKPASRLVGIGIILMMMISAVVLFDRIRISDIIFAVLTGVVIFRSSHFKAKNR